MSETRFSHVPLKVKGVQRHVLLPAMLLASSSVLLLSGCSSAYNPGLSPVGPADEIVATAKGKVHGGQFPVQGSTVNVYAAATTGYGAASTLQTTGTAPTTNSNGNFSISYHCTAGQELYLVATGGDPLNDGLGSNNSALVLTAAMGPCGNLFTGISGTFNITEVTTVATEYALAGFSKGYLNVGTSSTNTAGLANAFLTVTNLVNLSTGTALTVTPAYPLPGSTNGTTTPPDVFSSIVPADTINSIANSIAACVNVASGSNPACTNPSGPNYGLFDLTGGSQSLPSGNGVNNSPNAGTTLNTADAALYIAHNPGLPNVSGFTQPNNVAALLNLAGATPPFASPVLTAAPTDLTLTLNFVGGGMGGASSSSTSSSSYLAIDASSNIWVVNPLRKTVSEFNNLGAPLTTDTTVNASTHALLVAGGYLPGFTGANTSQSLGVDLTGNIWIADSSTNCLVGLSSTGTSLGSFPSLCPTTGAKGVTVDPNNNLWINGAGSAAFVSEATYSGGTATLTTGTPFTNPYTSGLITLTGYIQPDQSGNVWFPDGGSTNFDSLPSSAMQADGVLSSPSIFGALGPYTGPSNVSGGLGAWVVESSTNSLQPVVLTGPVATETQPPPFVPGTAVSPTGAAVDGNGLVYLASTSGTATNGTVPANLTVLTSGETLVSPYLSGYGGGSGLAGLDAPKGLAIDPSGNVWVVNNSNKSAHNGIGPYAGDYVFTSGLQASNLLEFVGLAAPTNPVAASAAKDGSASFGGTPTSAGTYGVKP